MADGSAAMTAVIVHEKMWSRGGEADVSPVEKHLSRVPRLLRQFRRDIPPDLLHRPTETGKFSRQLGLGGQTLIRIRAVSIG